MERQTIFMDHHVPFRLAVGLLGGLLVAGFLTWFMYALIQFSEQKADESARVHIVDFVRLKRDESSVQKERRAERPQTSEAPPAPAAPDVSESSGDAGGIAVMNLGMDTGMNVDVGGFGIGVNEGEFLPIVKVAPIYPSSAAAQGIEGYCVVRYTVTANGTTRDIEVVEDQCTYRGFRQPSLAAAARFKYKPRIVNGEPVEVQGVTNMFRFELEDAGGK